MRIWIAFRMVLVLTLLTGIIYPLAIEGVANLLFPFQARGSIIKRDGHAVGSVLIGQRFTSPGYFHGRPSAAGASGYNPLDSGGSNLGPTNRRLILQVSRRLREVLERNPGVTAAEVPIDLVTASASGLDPEISPAAAELQVPRVAKTRGISENKVMALVHAYTIPRWAGIFGEPGVNVLELNLALDRLTKPVPSNSRK